MFASLFLGVLNTASGALAYINAGHDPPVVLGPGGIKAYLTRTGIVVGIEPNLAYPSNRISLEPGDTLFAYTDGIPEARDSDGRFFTLKRLVEILQKPSPSAKDLVDEVFADLRKHSAKPEFDDDVTMLAVRRLP
jgi:sigma-B regulation protein RsbU (phosphoserine phosphatase)